MYELLFVSVLFNSFAAKEPFNGQKKSVFEMSRAQLINNN